MVEVTRRAVRSALLATAGATALLAGAQAAHAATADADTTGHGGTSTVGEVVVTAQRRTQNIQDVPESVQAVSSKQLLAAGIKSTQDLGQITPNVTIISPIGAGNQPLITIRGIGLNDFDTNNAGPNGVYVDDVYLSAPGVQNFSMFDIAQVQVLKGPQGTLYGRNTSGGALLFTSNRPTDYFTADVHGEYGDYNTLQLVGAMGGPIAPGLDGRIAAVINHSDGYNHNFLTGQPYDNVNNEAVRLQLQYESNDRLKLYFNTTVGYLNNHPEPYGHIGVFVPGTQNLPAPPGSPPGTPGPAPTKCTPAQAFAGGCVDLFGYGTPPFWQGAYAETQNLTNLAAITQFRADYKVGPITLTSITSWQYDKKFHPEDTDGDPLNLIRATYGVRSDTYTQEFRAAQSEKNFNWVAGIYYLHEKLSQNQPLSLFFDGDLGGGFGFGPGPGAFDGIAEIVYDNSKQVTDSAAMFAQGDYNFHRFTLTLGGRYTWERKTFDYSQSSQVQDGGLGNYSPITCLSPVPNTCTPFPESRTTASNFTYRVALSYHVTDQVQAYGSIATGFKSGGFNGSFLNNDAPSVLAQLKPVKPEEVTAYEIGEKATLFDHRLILDAALFYNAYRNEQVFGSVSEPITLGGVTTQILANVLGNAAASHTEGAEFQITAVPFDGLTIELDPALLRTRMDNGAFPGGSNLTGNELSNAPKFTFTAIVNYRWVLGNGDDIDFRWNSNYRSHYWFDATNDPYIQQNGYWLHNFNLDYESSQHWVAGVFIRNLANEKYNLTSSDISSPFGFLEPVEGPPRTFGVELSYHY